MGRAIMLWLKTSGVGVRIAAMMKLINARSQNFLQYQALSWGGSGLLAGFLSREPFKSRTVSPK